MSSIYSWRAQAFIRKSTSRPLALVCIILFVAFFGLVGGSFFYKIHKVVVAPGEVVSSLGEKEIYSLQEGIIENINIEVGQTVAKDQILAQIQIPLTSHEIVKKLLFDLKSDYDSMTKSPQNIVKFNYSSENPVISKYLSESLSALQKYQLSINENKDLVQKKIAFLTTKKHSLNKKLKTLEQSAQKEYLSSLMDELRDQIDQISTEELTLNQKSLSNIKQNENDSLSAIKNTYLQIYAYYDTYLVKASSTGFIARKNIYNLQTAKKNQLLFSILPDQNQFQVRLQLPSLHRGKVALNNEVRMSLDSFPYQQYGQFEGVIVATDRSPSSTDNNSEKSFVVYTSINKNNRLPAQEQILPGMKVKAYIRTQKVSAFQLIYQKLFNDETAE